MGLMDLTIDYSLSAHGDTLFMSGTKIAKLVYYAVDLNSTSTKLGLVDNPYANNCMLSGGNGFTGAQVGNTSTTGGSTAAMIPVFINSDIGIRVFSSAAAGSLIVITYIEVTS
jgi:hypothetical protein